MEQFISVITIFGILAGSFDAIIGYRYKVGDKFRQGFSMIGPMMLSMAGIMTIAPVIAIIVRPAANLLSDFFHIDPSVLSVILCCDMGGYPLAMSLTENHAVGLLMGVIVSGMIGGTLTFTIPMGYELLGQDTLKYFMKGVLIGVGCIPVGCLVGGILLGIPLPIILYNCLPVIILSGLIGFGMKKTPDLMLGIMKRLGKAVECISIAGIVLGCMEYLFHIPALSGLDPLMDSMLVICKMAVTLIGMFPAMTILSRLFEKPLKLLGKRMNLDADATLGLLFTMVSSVPVFPMLNKMSKKGIIINSAWFVAVSAVFGSQLGLVMGTCPEILPAFFAAKIVTGLAVILTMQLLFSRGKI